MKKTITIIILTIIALVFANGCYYVFWGQHRSAGKIRQGKELSAYEIGSIYTRRVMDQLEAAGVVGPQNGSRPREVLVSSLDELETILKAFMK